MNRVVNEHMKFNVQTTILNIQRYVDQNYVNSEEQEKKPFVNLFQKSRITKHNMKKVHSTKEAIEWFLSHSSGSVIAVNKKGEEKVCATYPEAEKHIKSA